VEAYHGGRARHRAHEAPLEAPVDLEQLAQIAAISKRLVRVFDEITGTTPHHFLAVCACGQELP
jgi:transcriptional regulator GlxA family with amidase domain